MEFRDFLTYLWSYWLAAKVTDRKLPLKDAPHFDKVSERLGKLLNAVRTSFPPTCGRYYPARRALHLHRSQLHHLLKVPETDPGINLFYWKPGREQFYGKMTRFAGSRRYREWEEKPLNIRALFPDTRAGDFFERWVTVPHEPIAFAGAVFNGYDGGEIWIGIRNDHELPPKLPPKQRGLENLSTWKPRLRVKILRTAPEPDDRIIIPPTPPLPKWLTVANRCYPFARYIEKHTDKFRTIAQTIARGPWDDRDIFTTTEIDIVDSPPIREVVFIYPQFDEDGTELIRSLRRTAAVLEEITYDPL